MTCASEKCKDFSKRFDYNGRPVEVGNIRFSK